MVYVQNVIKTQFLVSIVPEFYKCTLCGNDLKQHVNGKISYIPVIALSEKEKHELSLKDG